MDEYRKKLDEAFSVPAGLLGEPKSVGEHILVDVRVVK